MATKMLSYTNQAATSLKRLDFPAMQEAALSYMIIKKYKRKEGKNNEKDNNLLVCDSPGAALTCGM